MLFTAPEFLFGFLPIFLVIYAVVGSRWRNLVLFMASLLFYFTTSAQFTTILVLSVVVNWALALHMDRFQGRRRTEWVVVGVIINLAPLIYYKYGNFLISLFGDTLGALGWLVAYPRVDSLLPIGISFFTFQAISYLADVGMARIAPARNLINFGMYHSCFPQLIAGPIVRYEEIADEVVMRRHSLEDVYNGVVQFCFGLGKKVLLADSTGRIADAVFQLPDGGRGFGAAWIGIFAYTMQIYFDFSGYSDMAIGIGRILGFHYPENFNQPYLSCNVTEFWRRWHMTLSRWFRDYVYIPLGGNRHGLVHTLLNLTLVFFLCGLWHGAAYMFVIWGLLHGALLMIERLGRNYTGWRPPAIIGWAYTMVAVMLAWVFFRADSVTQATRYIADMVSPTSLVLPPGLYATLSEGNVFFLALAALIALVPFKLTTRLVAGRYFFGPIHAAAALAIALLAIVMTAGNGFTPFIYFRF